jgi:hypothetical protein
MACGLLIDSELDQGKPDVDGYATHHIEARAGDLNEIDGQISFHH